LWKCGAVDLDRTVAHATFIAAGELQADVNEVGPEHVAESDLRRAMRRGLQMRLGPVVVPEGGRSFKVEAWPGRLGKPDLAVVGGEGEADQAYVELNGPGGLIQGGGGAGDGTRSAVGLGAG
jgi:hypothetical protein